VAADDRAIVVGINRYPALGDLSGPENDARAFAEWLERPTGGNVPHRNICRILSSDFPVQDDALHAQPTAEALKLAIDELHELGHSNGGHAGRRLYLFLAGHGFAPDLEDAALLMANAAEGRTGHHIPGRPYANWFRRAAFFDEVVLFMDCCRENYPRCPLQACHLQTVKGRQPARYYYGFAADFSNVARERPDRDGVVRGIFTTALLAGLGEDPPEGDLAGWRLEDVTGSMLEDFVLNYLPELCKGQEFQDPQFSFKRKDDIVLTRRYRPVFRIRICIAPEDLGREVQMFDGSFHPLPPIRSGGVWEWELGPGLYKYGFSGGPYYLRELIGRGETIDVQL
jgi:Caspase domain